MRIIFCFIVFFAFPHWSTAKGLEKRLAQTAVSAVVKVGSLNAQGKPVGFGSGTMIDARGYVLTNFHVVGNTKTGVLINRDNKVLLGLVRSARESVRYHWEGRVVRADPRLDLALIRILKDITGKPLGGRSFPTLTVASTKDLEPGSPVWVVGFPAGVRSVNMTAGTIAGFEMNVAQRVSWLRTDAEINPGNSGGQLIDDQGRLVGIPTQVRVADRQKVVEAIGFARPAERIPGEWIQALKSGHLDDVKISGEFKLPIGKGLHDQVVGDYIALDGAERRFYVVPEGRSGTIRMSDSSINIGLLRQNLSVVRSAQGELEVKRSDPHPMLLTLMFPQETLSEPKTFWVLFQEEDAMMADLDKLEQGLAALKIQGTEKTKNSSGLILDSTGKNRSPVTIVGRISDALSGAAIYGMVAVAKPGIDLKKTIDLLRQGTISKAEFNDRVMSYPSSPSSGFTARLPRRERSYQIFVGSSGYRPQVMTVNLQPQSTQIELGEIKLSK